MDNLNTTQGYSNLVEESDDVTERNGQQQPKQLAYQQPPPNHSQYVAGPVSQQYGGHPQTSQPVSTYDAGTYQLQNQQMSQYAQGFPQQDMPGVPVVAQPGIPRFASRPPMPPGCPPGLEYLTQVDQLLVHQQVELIEALTGWETQNRYQIKNTVGQQIYFAGEESDVCGRMCCGPSRAFIMHITDNMGQEVIRIDREFKCGGCRCCAFSDCCAMTLAVEAPPGNVIGYVKQQFSCCTPKFDIQDQSQQTVMSVEGPVCICQGICCTGDVDYPVQTNEDQDIGKISKQWSGFWKELFTSADNFSVTFPMDLDVKMKAILLSTVFLIDFMYYERKSRRNNSQFGYGQF